MTPKSKLESVILTAAAWHAGCLRDCGGWAFFSGPSAPECDAQAAAKKISPPAACTDFPPQAKSPYILPYEAGKVFRVIRTTEHYTPGNGGVGAYAIDFDLPMRTPVVAARAGVVAAVQERFSRRERQGPGGKLRLHPARRRHHRPVFPSHGKWRRGKGRGGRPPGAGHWSQWQQRPKRRTAPPFRRAKVRPQSPAELQSTPVRPDSPGDISEHAPASLWPRA